MYIPDNYFVIIVQIYKLLSRICLHIFLLFNLIAFSQRDEFYHKLIVKDSIEEFTIDKTISKSEINLFLNKYLSDLRRNGYVFANCDSVFNQNDSLFILIFKGKKYRHIDIKSFNIKSYNEYNFEAFFKKINLKVPFLKLNENLSELFLNNGYPFYSFNFQNIFSTNDTIAVNVNYNPNVKVYFDTLVFDSPIKSTNSYLQSVLNIKKGQVFSQKKIDNINNIFLAGKYFELKSQPYIVFKLDKAYVHLDIKEKGNTQINGILGLTTNQITKKNVIVGDANIIMKNIAGQGITVDLKWQKYQTQSQNLVFNGSLPYIFKSSVGLSASLDLLKQDTSFVQVTRKLSFDFRINVFSKVSAFYLSTTSAVNNKFATENIYYRSTRISQYGLKYQLITSNASFFPTKGFEVCFSINSGLKNSSMASDSITQSTQTNVEGTFSKFIKLHKRAVFAVRSETKYLHNNKNQVFQNDLYRLGGISDLRGFNEKSFFVDKYATLSLEFRYLLSLDSYFNMFIDQGLIQEPFHYQSIQQPTGGGLGFALKTQIGIIKIMYSLGKSNTQTIALQNSKLHVSLSSLW